MEQLAFADVLVLNKIDLVSEEEAAALEGRIRRMNAVARVHRASRANVPLGAVLEVGGFDLRRALSIDPAFLADQDHAHDASVSSVGIHAEGDVDRRKLERWLSGLLRENGADIFRIEGDPRGEGDREPLRIPERPHALRRQRGPAVGRQAPRERSRLHWPEPRSRRSQRGILAMPRVTEGGPAGRDGACLDGGRGRVRDRALGVSRRTIGGCRRRLGGARRSRALGAWSNAKGPRLGLRRRSGERARLLCVGEAAGGGLCLRAGGGVPRSLSVDAGAASCDAPGRRRRRAGASGAPPETRPRRPCRARAVSRAPQ
jgi:hypothetical protein